MAVGVVDDDPSARRRLARMVEKLEHHVVAQADSAQAALEAIATFDPDVVLVDIRMPGEDGIEAARKISALDDPPAVIFCTAYDQYALDAFATEAVSYLLKPVRAEQLQDVLERAQRPNRLQRAATRTDEQPQRNHVSAKTLRGVELIPLDDVRAFIADQKYVTVHHVNGEHLLDDTLKDLEEEFGHRLLRIHRSALVSVQHIQAMERTPQGHYEVRLVDVPVRPQVSRRHASALKALLQKL